MDATPCKFPQCDEPTTLEVARHAREAFFLCVEHRQLLLEDPARFRRRWGARKPRPDAAT